MRPNTGAMRKLSLGSATTIATLMCIPDAVGIIPLVPDPLAWCIRITGLWLSAFILWSFGFIATLYFARFAGGGILINARGIKFWRFGKTVEWRNIKALTLDTQPLFSIAFGLAGTARRLLVFEEKTDKTNSKKKLVPHPVPSFQFSQEEFTSLFAYICDNAMHFVPHSTEAYIFEQEQSQFLRSSGERAAILRKVLSVIIAVGLVLFLGRKASLNYYFNQGTVCFRHENYPAATKNFKTATKIDQTFAAAWDQLARSEFRTGDVGQAEKHWQRALQMKPDLVEAKLGISNILISRNEFKKAELLLEQCAQLAPHNCAVYLNQAVLYQKLGEIETARKLLSTVRHEAMNNPDTLVKAANIYDSIGDRVIALAVLDEALNIDPQNRSALSLMTRFKSERTAQ